MSVHIEKNFWRNITYDKFQCYVFWFLTAIKCNYFFFLKLQDIGVLIWLILICSIHFRTLYFHFNSTKGMLIFLDFSHQPILLLYTLPNFYKFMYFLSFLLLLLYYINLWCSKRIQDEILLFRYLLRLALDPNLCKFLRTPSPRMLTRMCIRQHLDGKFYSCIWFMMPVLPGFVSTWHNLESLRGVYINLGNVPIRLFHSQDYVAFPWLKMGQLLSVFPPQR